MGDVDLAGTQDDVEVTLPAGLLPLDEAVVAVDRVLATRAARPDDVRALAAEATGRGSARARRACSLADGLAGSPQETRLRLQLHRSGLPLPVAQHEVLDDRGRFVARVDFGWPEHRVAVEYDGSGTAILRSSRRTGGASTG